MQPGMLRIGPGCQTKKTKAVSLTGKDLSCQLLHNLVMCARTSLTVFDGLILELAARLCELRKHFVVTGVASAETEEDTFSLIDLLICRRCGVEATTVRKLFVDVPWADKKQLENRMALRQMLGWSDGELMRSDAKPCSRLMRQTAGICTVGGALGFWVLCRLHYGPRITVPRSLRWAACGAVSMSSTCALLVRLLSPECEPQNIAAYDKRK